MPAKKHEPWELDFGPAISAVRGAKRRFLSRPTLLDFIVVAAIIGILASLLSEVMGINNRDYTRVFPPAPCRPLDPQIVAIAGEDYRGYGRGRNEYLELTRDGRYSYIRSGCLGVYEKGCGYIRILDGKVHLFPSRPAPEPRPIGNPWHEGYPNGLRIVRWGDRRYLIADRERQEFADAIRDRREPREDGHGNFFLADCTFYEEPMKRSEAPLPEVPDSWRALMPERLTAEALPSESADLGAVWTSTPTTNP